MAKLLKTLCKELELENENQYFEYIFETLINGQRGQVRELFNDMRKDDKRIFLNDHLGFTPEENELRTICIEELLV
jgi:hypothetical protein